MLTSHSAVPGLHTPSCIFVHYLCIIRALELEVFVGIILRLSVLRVVADELRDGMGQLEICSTCSVECCSL